MSFLTDPGGLSEYFDSFLIQFFLYPIAAVFIVTMAGIACYTLTSYIFRRYNIYGILWPYIPILLLVSLQSDYTYSFVNTLGLVIALTFVALYISIRKPNLRHATGLIGWIFLYLAIGGFSLLATVLCIVHELLFTKDRYRIFVVSGFALMAALLPYLLWRSIYIIPFVHAWSSPIVLPKNVTTQYALLLLFGYFPLLLILIKSWFILSKKTEVIFNWKWKTILAGMIVLFAFTWWIKKYAYDPENELLFRMDNSIQHSEWDHALKLSTRYPDKNRLFLYFTNLALYKSGKMGDEMFHYDQIDASGLWLDLPGTQFPYFFGCDIYYHLSYINKAYRWAFDAMVLTKYSPRLLKQLVLISLIKGDNPIAEKYLNVLDQTLFYRKWAQHYRDYLNDPGLLIQDRELNEKRRLLLSTDKIQDTYNPYNVLILLLENHLENRMAYEYFMASLLLDKSITIFAENISYLKYYGYKEIPVHYEEALLEYMYYTEKKIVPEGYLIRKSTVQRYNNFLKAYSSYSGNLDKAAQILYKTYGKTYWYYLHFKNKKIKIQ